MMHSETVILHAAGTAQVLCKKHNRGNIMDSDIDVSSHHQHVRTPVQSKVTPAKVAFFASRTGVSQSVLHALASVEIQHSVNEVYFPLPWSDSPSLDWIEGFVCDDQQSEDQVYFTLCVGSDLKDIHAQKVIRLHNTAKHTTFLDTDAYISSALVADEKGMQEVIEELVQYYVLEKESRYSAIDMRRSSASRLRFSGFDTTKEGLFNHEPGLVTE